VKWVKCESDKIQLLKSWVKLACLELSVECCSFKNVCWQLVWCIWTSDANNTDICCQRKHISGYYYYYYYYYSCVVVVVAVDTDGEWWWYMLSVGRWERWNDAVFHRSHWWCHESWPLAVRVWQHFCLWGKLLINTIYLFISVIYSLTCFLSALVCT